MNRLICLIACIGLFLLLPLHAAALSSSDLTAESAVLIDADTGQILFEKESRQRRHPASITKVMTGIVVLEHCSPSEILRVSEEAVDLPWDSSHIALRPGEELTVSDAMYAMMLPSANDASNALAEHTSGSQAAFAQLMNAKAAQLGAVDTHFANAHGLSDDDHYTTAYDMALITRAAIRVDEFMNYFSAERHTMPPTNLQIDSRNFYNYQYMLRPEMWVYNPDVLGGKVGYTTPAGHTMTTAARHDGRTLIAVVMGTGKDQKFYDTQVLLDYGFGELFPVEVPLSAAPLRDHTAAVTENGAIVGEAVFSLTVPSVTLLLPQGVTANDVRIDYNLPASFHLQEGADASVRLSLPAATAADTPTLVLEVPLDVRVQGTFDSDVAEEESPGFQDLIAWIGNRAYLLVALPALLILIAVAKVLRERRRAARRMQRRQRVLKEQQRRYQGRQANH